MGNSPAIAIGKNNNMTNLPSPFWHTGVKKQGNDTKKILKQIWKWIKLLALIFFTVMGLWGCLQSTWDTDIKTASQLGQGMEFGFTVGTSGDYRYDLVSNGNLGYYAFNSFTWQFGPFYALFVYPGAWFATLVSYSGRNMWGGLNVFFSIFLLLLIIRSFSIIVSLRSTLQNEKMSELQGKIAEINGKYKGLTDAFSKQKKSQEIMILYKKHNVKPFAAFEQVMITLPIFMIIFRVVSICRPMKATTLLGIWNFGATPTTQIFTSFVDGGWLYIFFLLIVMPVQFISSIIPQLLAKKRNRNATTISSAGNKQAKKTKIIQLVITCVMCGIVAFSATGVGVYWFLSAIFSIAQTTVMHSVIMKNRKKGGNLESKLDKFFNV